MNTEDYIKLLARIKVLEEEVAKNEERLRKTEWVQHIQLIALIIAIVFVASKLRW